MNLRKAGSRLKVLAQIVRLAFKAPGMYFRMARKYKVFREAFVEAAVQAGMPAQYAQEAIRAMRPAVLMQGIKSGKKQKEE